MSDFNFHKVMTLCMTSSFIVCTAGAAMAQSTSQGAQQESQIEVLRQQLEAQITINDELRKALKQAQSGIPASAVHQVALDPTLPAAKSSSEEQPALDQYLGKRGLALLPEGSVRVTPSAGFGIQSSKLASQFYAASVDVGLPSGWMASANLPYLSISLPDAKASGFSDVSLGLSKVLQKESVGQAGWVGRVGYLHNNGSISGEVPIGSGAKRLDFSLSGYTKRSPITYSWGASYSHPLTDKVNFSAPSIQAQGDAQSMVILRPGKVLTLSTGASLSVSPSETLSAALSVAVVQDYAIGGGKLPTQTLGFLAFGLDTTSFMGRPASFYSSVGLNRPTPALTLGISMPFRF